MPRTTPVRFFRSTQTAPNAGNVEDILTTAGSAAVRSGTAAFTTGGTATTYRFNPRVASTAVAVPASGTSASGQGWRDTAGDNPNESVRYDAGTWNVHIRAEKDGQAVSTDITLRMTAIVYRVTSAGAVPASGVHEIGRATLPDVVTQGSAASYNQAGSFTTASPTTFDPGDKIQVEVYVTHITAGLPSAPASAVNIHFLVDMPGNSTSGRLFGLPGHQYLYGRALSEPIPTTDSISRRTAYNRTLAESLPTTDTMTRSKGAIRGLAETIPLTDALTRTKGANRTLAESIPTTDSLTRVKGAIRSLSESIPTTDALTRVKGAVRGLVESIPFTDSIARQLSSIRGFIENIPTTDAAARIVAFGRGPTENIPTTDTVTRSMGYSRRPIENLAGASDTIITEPTKVWAGIARDEYGDPVEGAEVFLIRQSDFFRVQNQTTGADGVYSFVRDENDFNAYFTVVRLPGSNPQVHGVSDFGHTPYRP